MVTSRGVLSNRFFSVLLRERDAQELMIHLSIVVSQICRCVLCFAWCNMMSKIGRFIGSYLRRILLFITKPMILQCFVVREWCPKAWLPRAEDSLFLFCVGCCVCTEGQRILERVGVSTGV